MILKKIRSAALIGLLCASAAGASLDMSLEKGMTFTEARKLLLKQHWKPKRTTRATEHFAVDKALLRQHIVEVDVCTVDSFCVFRYTRDRQCLKLVAHGEGLNDLTVSSWDKSCPDDGERHDR